MFEQGVIMTITVTLKFLKERTRFMIRYHTFLMSIHAYSYCIIFSKTAIV
jgi:hypothetical protein